MKASIAAGGIVESWHRSVSLVIIKDKSLEDVEWFTEKLIKEIDGTLMATDNKYHFVQPDTSSAFFQ